VGSRSRRPGAHLSGDRCGTGDAGVNVSGHVRRVRWRPHPHRPRLCAESISISRGTQHPD
jgi:hypothetical protein